MHIIRCDCDLGLELLALWSFFLERSWCKGFHMEAYLGHVDLFSKVPSTSAEDNDIPKPNGARSFADALFNKVSQPLPLPLVSCA